MSDVGQIQLDPRAGLNQLLDFGSKNVSAFDHQTSGATYDGRLRLYIEFKAELQRSASAWLRHNCAKINEKWARCKRALLNLEGFRYSSLLPQHIFNVADSISEKIQFVGEALNFDMGATVDIEIQLTAKPVLLVLPVLTHHDHGRLYSCQH